VINIPVSVQVCGSLRGSAVKDCWICSYTPWESPKEKPRRDICGLTQDAIKEEKMKFVIIGGDAAGMSAASRAKRRQPEIDVTVLEQTRDVSYSA